MNRITPVELENADPKSRALLEAAQKKMGMIPNMLKTLGHSSAALEAYMSLSGALAGGSLSARIREQVALAAAGVNGCDYCASAHTAIGKSLKIDESELERNLAGASDDATTAAALAFVGAVIENRGKVSDAELQAVRDAGFTDGEIAELVAAIALNTLTNFFNRLADPEIDFPVVSLQAA
jgi:uncharacterized peroxidase-related enzyme